MQPAIDPLTLRRWDLLEQLRQLLSTHPSEGAHIHMPERFCLADQAGPGAGLLPLTQARLGMVLPVMDEDGHESTLMLPRPITAKQRSHFGVLKQKSSGATGAIRKQRSSRSLGGLVIGHQLNRHHWKLQFGALPLAQPAGPGTFDRVVPTETRLLGLLALIE